MHTQVFKTKFTFGDEVRFDSEMHRLSGQGTVFGITLAHDGTIDYIIEIHHKGYSDLQPGILEHEITLITPSQANINEEKERRIGYKYLVIIAYIAYVLLCISEGRLVGLQ